MKLNDIQSRQLLPRFARDIQWIQNAFDAIVKIAANRSISIDAPLTLEAIAALTDEELEAYYKQYGVVEYYPELARETRNNMLYWLSRMYRYLGTPEAITRLCRYVYDEVSIIANVQDNLAFDDAGNLIDEDLLDLFDVVIDVEDPTVIIDKTQRIVDNIFRVCRNSQTLRDIIYRYEGDIETTLRMASECVNAVFYVNNEIAKIPTTRAVMIMDTSDGSETVATICGDPNALQITPIQTMALNMDFVTENPSITTTIGITPIQIPVLNSSVTLISPPTIIVMDIS